MKTEKKLYRTLLRKFEVKLEARTVELMVY